LETNVFGGTVTSEQERALPVSYFPQWLMLSSEELRDVAIHNPSCKFSASDPVWTITPATTKTECLALSSAFVWKSYHVACWAWHASMW